MLRLILFSFLFVHGVYSQDWQYITPLPHCADLQLEYQVHDGIYYHVRYRPNPQADRYVYIQRQLLDINDLSSLTDEIVDASYAYCPLELTIGEIELICRDTNQSSPFDPEYISFLRDFINQVDRQGQNCDDVIPYIRLQSRVSALREEELINFNSSGNILRWFTGSDTDRMIDHIRECGGGTEGTRQFIQNMILLEARDACIFPSPPGLIGFEESIEIAAQVASEYPSLGLLAINSRKHDIAKRTVQAFLGPIVNAQVSQLHGAEMDVDRLLENLPSVQSLNNIKPKRALDYTNMVLSTDLPLELVDHVLPNMIEGSLAASLPEMENQAEFVQNELIGPITEDYQSCIEPFKERLRFHEEGLSAKDQIRHRKRLAEAYCDRNQASCEQTGCEAKRNYMTERSDITDFSVLQSCIYQSINSHVGKVLHETIRLQVSGIDSLSDISEDSKRRLERHGEEILLLCIENKAKELSGKDFNQITPNHAEAWLHLEPNQYSNMMLDCAKVVEREMTEEIATLTVARTPAYSDMYPDGAQTQIHGIDVSEVAHQNAQEFVEQIMNRCYAAQGNNIQNTNSALCLPILEMRAGQEIVSANINDLLSEYELPEASRNTIINRYRECTDQSIDSAYADISGEDLSSIEKASSYLNNHPDYLSCAKAAIDVSVNELASHEMQKLRDQMIADGMDVEFFDGIARQAQINIRNCFREGIDRNETWNEFIQFNDNGGLEELQTRCMTEVEESALPPLVAHELDRQISALTETNTISLTTEEFIRQLGGNENNQESSEQIILNLYREFKQEHPEADINAFIEDFSNRAQIQTMGSIHAHIIQELTRHTRSGFPEFVDFQDAVTPACLNSLYELHQENLNILINRLAELPESEEPTDIQETFVELLTGGLIRAKLNNRYEDMIETINNICEDPSKFSDLQSFVDIRIADDFLIDFLQNEILNSFYDTAEQQCFEDLVELDMLPDEGQSRSSNHIPQNIVNSFCSKDVVYEVDSRGIINAIKAFYRSNPEKQAYIDFIWNRKKQTINLAREKLNYANIELLFTNDRDVLNFIYDNFTDVVARDPAKTNELTSLILSKVFEDRSENSFTSQFIELQIVSSVGIQGLEQAKTQMYDQIDNMSGIIQGRGFVKRRARRFANEVFHDKWTFTGIRHHLNWDGMLQSEREELIELVVANNIMPRFNPDLSEAELASMDRRMSAAIETHLDEHRSIPNPDFRPARRVPHFTRTGTLYYMDYPEQGPRELTFSESLSLAIEEDISDRVADSVWPF